MDMNPTLDGVMGKLDEWVARHGDGTYTHPRERVLPEDSGIQQIRGELEVFGVVAFHDVVEEHPGGPNLVIGWLGARRPLKMVAHAPHCGIAWFNQGELL